MSPFRCLMSVVLVALLLPNEASSKRLYQYRDKNGVLHVSDRPPPGDIAASTEVKTQLVHAEEQSIVELFTNDAGNEHHVTLVNRTAGEVSVLLELVNSTNIASEPRLPLTVVLSAFEQRVVARAFPADRYQDSRFGLQYTGVPGRVDAVHDDSVAYSIPFAADAQFVLAQGFNGRFTHQDVQSRYAVDLGVDEGTPVLCAREGVVMMVEEDFHGAGLDREKFAGRANNVRVLHSDGSMAVYAHLQLESARVKAGQRVSRGQVIGLSGNTGFSTGPHLHFAVQVNAGMELRAVPFHFEDNRIPL